jgi:hypothetical protein
MEDYMIKSLTKKLVLVLMSGLILTGTVFSESILGQIDKELTLNEKMNFYSQQKSSPKDSIFFASCFGMGSGSFIQNDMLGGFIGMTADIAGLSLLGTGFYLNNSIWSPDTRQYASTYLISGALILLSSRIFQYVRPIIITEEKNKDLLIKLGLSIDF